MRHPDGARPHKFHKVGCDHERTLMGSADPGMVGQSSHQCSRVNTVSLCYLARYILHHQPDRHDLLFHQPRSSSDALLSSNIAQSPHAHAPRPRPYPRPRVCTTHSHARPSPSNIMHRTRCTHKTAHGIQCSKVCSKRIYRGFAD